MLGKIEGRKIEEEDNRGWDGLIVITDHHWGHEFEQAPGDAEGLGNLVCYSPQVSKEADTTKQLNNNNDNISC